MFGGHKHCGSRDIIILVCHVISQNHVIERHVSLQAGTYQGNLPSSQI